MEKQLETAGKKENECITETTASPVLWNSLQTLRAQYDSLNWVFYDVPVGSEQEKMYRWPGAEDEDIMICVRMGNQSMSFSTGRTISLSNMRTSVNLMCSVMNMTTN